MSAARWNDWAVSQRLAGGALVAALAWDAFVALRPLPVVSHLPPPAGEAAMPSIRRRAFDDPALVSAAASRSPFGGSAPVAAPSTFVNQAWAAAAAPLPRLVGTVAQEGRGFVMVELPDASLRLVRVGERAAGLTLLSVGHGSAIFQDSAGHRVPLRSPAPGTGTPP